MNPFEKVPSQNGAKDFLGVGEAVEKGEGRKLLKELEASGLFVFHGSSNSDVVQLEPRQAEDWKTGDRIEHGKPAVCATPFADLAIFRSLVKEDYTSFGTTDDERRIYCAASDKAMVVAKDARGYVYVMLKGDFEVFEGGSMEVRAHSNIKPIRVVEVFFDDLPPGILRLDEEGHLTTERVGDKL